MSKKRPEGLVPDTDLPTDLDRLFLHDWADKGTAAQVRRIAVLISRDRDSPPPQGAAADGRDHRVPPATVWLIRTENWAPLRRRETLPPHPNRA
jgi:hypothetical protein